MKIIDAHLHYFDTPNFNILAESVGHVNSAEHLERVFAENGIVRAIVMGNGGLSLSEHNYAPFMSWCAGINEEQLLPENYDESIALAEEQLKNENCVGLKFYPGYTHRYVSDPVYAPFFELARRYCCPIAIHTGTTAGIKGLLKYSHPLTLDDVAFRYPDVSIVMCHFGNPWLTDAAAVISKNKNVSADLSGLLEGTPDIDSLFAGYSGYMEQLQTWLQYAGAWDRIMYATDWPLVNIPKYIEFIKRLVPEKHHEAVFFSNANRIYSLGL